MSAPQPRLLETYNSLTDKHLVGYFSNARIRRHLQKSGLISRSGRIIPEKEYRLNAIRRDHQRHVQQCLADAIYHKVLDMEYHRQLGMNRSLDYSARKEMMQPVKMERSLGEVVHLYSPHPPTAPRNHHSLCAVVSGERTGRSQRRGPRLGLDFGDGHYCYRSKEPACCKVGESSGSRCRNPVECMAGVSPYQPPAPRRRRRAPVPPPRPHLGDRCIPGIRRGLPVERWFHPTTGFNEQFLINNTNGFPKSPLCSNALVTMIYLGKSKHVSLREYKDEIKVYQQYCGTENICVYKGDLLEGDTFQFISKRYLGYPFSLTFYLNGLQVDRLSCCCEYRGFQSKRPSRLRRRNTYFRVLHVAGAPPCYRCFLAMGLDKKLFPPKRKLKYYAVPHMCCCSPHCAHSEPCESSVLQRSIEGSVSLTIPSHGDSVATIDETLQSGEQSSEEEEDEEEMEDRSCEETEDTTQENTSESEYDEDFEADEEVNEKGQTGDQMNGMSESSSDDKKHNLNYGKESETSSQKALQASGSEKDESGGYSGDRDPGGDLPERRPADSVSSMSTQCSIKADSQAEMEADHVNCKEDCNIKGTSGSPAHAHCGNENGEKKLLRVEENQENSALEKKGIDEAEKTKPEDLTAREDTRVFHENLRATQHQNPEVNGEFKQTGSGESDMIEEEKCPPVPWESRRMSMEDGNEECPWREEGGDCKPVQEEIAKASRKDHPVNSEPGDLCANEEEKNTANTEGGASGAAAGRFLAEGRRSPDVQEAAGQGPGQALEQDGAAEGDAGSPGVAGTAAGAAAALPESAPEEHPQGKGTGGAEKLGTELSPGEQGGLREGMDREVALGQPAAGALPGWGADTAVPQGQEGAGGTSEEEEAAEEGLKGVEEEEGEPVSEAGASLGSAGKDTLVGAVSEGEEAVEDAAVAADGNARAVGPEGEKAVEEDFSEGEEAVGKPRALWEALGDMETGEIMSGGEGFVKPSQFSQLEVPEEEWMEMGKAVPGAAAAPGSAQALQSVEDTREGSVEPDKGPALEVAPGLGALGDARGDPVTEGSSQAEDVMAVQEEGAAAALGSGNPSEGSKAETERAVEGEPEGEEGGSAGAAGAGSGDEEEAPGGAAGSRGRAAGAERGRRCGQVRGKGRSPGEGVGDEAALPCGPRAGEPGLVAIAVLGGQAGPAALPGGPAVAMAQEGVAGAELGAQEGSATGRAGAGPAGAPAGGGEARAASPARGARGRQPELGAGAGCAGEQPSAEPSPSRPAPGHGGVAAGGTGGGERPCPGTQPAATGGRQEGMEQAGGTAEGQQPGPGDSTGEDELAAVPASAGAAAGAGEQGKDRPGGGSPGVPAAAETGERSRSSLQDGANPDPLIMSSEEDGEETLL